MSAQSKKNRMLNGRDISNVCKTAELAPTEAIGLHVAPIKRFDVQEPGLQEADRIKTTDLCHEKHYSVADLAELWNLSEKTIRRMFGNEPGVLLWGDKERRFKRAYTTVRIPETVALRVHRRLRVAG